MKSITEYVFSARERRDIDQTPTVQICRALDALFPVQLHSSPNIQLLPDEAAFTDVDGKPWLSVRRLDHATTQYSVDLDLPAPPKIEPVKTALPIRNKAAFIYDLNLMGQMAIPAESFTHLSRIFGPTLPGERWRDPISQQTLPTLAIRGIALVLTNLTTTGKRNTNGTPAYA